MAGCTGIAAGITRVCADIPSSNLDSAKIWVAAWSPSHTYTETDSIISGITLADSADAYVIEGVRSSANGSSTLNAGDFQDTLMHEITFIAFKRDQPSIEVLESLINQRVIVITRDNDGEYKLFGRKLGLTSTENTINYAENDGLPSVTLQTPSQFSAKEPKHPQTIFLTSQAETDALIAALEPA